MDEIKLYEILQDLINQCSSSLEEKYGIVLSGTPTHSDIIKKFNEIYPNDTQVIYGQKLIEAFEAYNIHISSDSLKYQAFLEQVR